MWIPTCHAMLLLHFMPMHVYNGDCINYVDDILRIFEPITMAWSLQKILMNFFESLNDYKWVGILSFIQNWPKKNSGKPGKTGIFVRIWNPDPEFRKFEIRFFKKPLAKTYIHFWRHKTIEKFKFLFLCLKHKLQKVIFRCCCLVLPGQS